MSPDELKSLQSNAGMSNPQAAIQLGVSLRTFMTWRAGTRNISAPMATLIKLTFAKPYKGQAAASSRSSLSLDAQAELDQIRKYLAPLAEDVQSLQTSQQVQEIVGRLLQQRDDARRQRR